MCTFVRAWGWRSHRESIAMSRAQNIMVFYSWVVEPPWKPT